MRLEGKKKSGGVIGRILRTLFWALVFAFLFGFLIGTLLRREIDQPTRYIGAAPDAESAPPTRPGNVGHALSRILVPGDHEEQIG